MDGWGRLEAANGDIYEGEWENDRKNGKGRLYSGETGDWYVGEFNEDKKMGKGRLYEASNKD